MARKIKKNDITLKPQAGGGRTLLATWVWSRAHTYGYEVEWDYLTKDGIWFKGKQETVGTPIGADKYDTYTAPELATKVRLRIRPKATSTMINESPNDKYIVSNNPNDDKVVGGTSSSTVISTSGTAIPRWIAEWSVYKTYDVETKLDPEVPQVPDVEISNNSINLRCTSYDLNTTHIAFEVVMDDSSIYWTSAWIPLTTNVASVSKSIPLGHTFKARAKAYNSKAKSQSEYSQYSSNNDTVPEGIGSDLAVQAVSSTSVKLNWNTIPNGVENYEIEYTTNQEYFGQSTSVQSATVGAEHPYAIIEGLETGKTWFFRIRAKNSKGSSSWSEIVSCTIGTTPSAPTVWSSSSTVVVGEGLKLYWIHNSEDGSQEQKAKLRISYPGDYMEDEGDIIVVKEDDSDISVWEIEEIPSVVPDGFITWSVATMGATGEYGPFSETSYVEVLTEPTLSISVYKNFEWLWDPFNFETDTIYTAQGAYRDPYSPGNMEIEKYPIFFVVTMYPMYQTPIEANFSIYAKSSYLTLNYVGEEVWVNEGDLIFSKTIPYTDENINLTKNKIAMMLTPGDVILENFTEYDMVVTVVSDNSLSAEGTITFTMNIEEEEFYPDAEIGIDRSAVVAYIQPTCYDENDNPLYGVRMSVYRREFDGGFVKIGEDVDSSSQTTLVDPHPNLNVARYRVVGFSNTTGSFLFYDLPSYPVNVPEIILQWDEKWTNFDAETEDALVDPVWNGSMLRLPYNIDVSESNSLDVQLVEYIGRKHPVSYYGTQVGQTMSLSTDILRSDAETLYALRRLAVWMGDVYVREPGGSGYWANVAVSMSSNNKAVVIPVTISVTRVEGGM